MLEFKKINDLEKEIKHYSKLCKLFSILRFIVAVCVIVMVICLITLDNGLLYGILTGCSLICFLGLVIGSTPIYQRRDILLCKEKAYSKHKQRREKNFTHFSDNGNEFKNIDDYKLSDLDIFGPKSLYQYLCEAKTPLGRTMLAKQLSNPDVVDNRFTGLVAHLADNEESIELEGILLEFDKKAYTAASSEFTSAVGTKIPFKISYILPLLSFLLMIVYVCVMVPLQWNLYVPLGFLALNLALTKLFANDPILTKDAYAYHYLSDLYYELAKGISVTSIEDEYYTELKNCIHNDLATLRKIRSIYTILKIRRNVILNIILNLICSFDVFVLLYLKMRINTGLHLEQSLESIATIEVALSFKNIGFDNEYYTIPEDGESISVENIFHPFVKNCVSNSITFVGGILLTGSNMSGKTTFMRTLGICQVLKNANSIVPAKKFASPKLNIYTSLRANDMLQEGISTFYAEIKRMKKINTQIKVEPCLILVDEIFKGTNAKERISASIAVIDKLNDYHAFFIVSTHDHELCDTKGILNYHFDEQYVNDEISFDYSLKEGSCTKGNALYLLKMSGIIEE